LLLSLTRYNNAFIDMFNARKSKPKIIIVDPRAKDIIEKKLPSAFRPTIINVEREFGDLSSINAIEFALSNRMPGDIT